MPFHDMYKGGLRVVDDDANPDSMAQSAHSLRELMKTMGEQLGTEPGKATDKQGPKLMDKVREAEDHFDRHKKLTKCHVTDRHGGSEWSGEIDQRLRKLLRKLDAFFDWVHLNRPRHRKQTYQALEKMDPSGRAVPEFILKAQYKEWEGYRNFFVAVCHHGKIVKPEAFWKEIEGLEKFLADRLLPRTFDDLAAIDELLEIADA